MAKSKRQNEYTQLLSLSNNLPDRVQYTDKVFIVKQHGVVVSTDGCKLIADRRVFSKLSILAALFDSEHVLQFNSESGLFEKSETGSINDSIIGLIPSSETFKTKKCIRLQLPDMLNSISKRDKKPIITFILGDHAPVLTMGFYPDGIAFNAHYLAPHTGETIDIYMDATDSASKKRPVTILPAGQAIETAEWFSILCPMSKDDNAAMLPSYV
jgi:hypothetical protein